MAAVNSLADDVVEHTTVLKVTNLGFGVETKDCLERSNRSTLNLGL